MSVVMLRAILAAVLLFATPLIGLGQPTPAEQKISVARKSIEVDPSRHEPYAELALALARRARETSDPVWYRQAQDALDRSFALAPGNLEAERARIWVLLGQHEFGQALERAQALNRRVPDDLMSYAFLVDANAELGNYEAAEQAAQWLLDLRPGNVAGLTRAAYLRELFGDVEGALDLMRTALQRTPPGEVEDRAWLLTQIAHLELLVGRVDAADMALAPALALFPGYHYALGKLAHVRAAQGRLEESMDLLRRRYELAPHPENLFELGEALQRAGKLEEASQTFEAFERAARAEMDRPDNSNRELAFYYAEYGANPHEALRIAQREVERRHDVHTLDVYAWALYRNGRYGEAEMRIADALRVGVREAGMLYRAGAIAFAANDRNAAASRLTESLARAPHAPTAIPARRLLGELGTVRPAR